MFIFLQVHQTDNGKSSDILKFSNLKDLTVKKSSSILFVVCMQQNSILHQKFQKQKSFKQKYAIILLTISQLSAVGTFFYIHSTYE